ncbi:hypothetical protein [Bradyrhizobium sp.]|uniref:hypothetical protein n=1 Tax=Bradyrhizobium sp. TaxID=376 RepID=UPI0025BF8A03|nr:hypothetical protein [Bradyrhizobium sp.]
MADEAFALSPISARASLPGEEDYEAISHAFMETSRGRWFLGEYAKRNRNADTRMVLDAVARIEQTVAAQKQAASESRLTEALAAVRRAVYEAQGAAAAAVQNLGLEENLAPVRKGSRIIKEISWRWREIGADGRICDLLDSQVTAIDDACGQITSASLQAALIAAFDLIKTRIAALDDRDAAAPPPPAAQEAAPPPFSSAASDAMPNSFVEAVEEMPAAKVSDAATSMPAEAVEDTPETLDLAPEAIETPEEGADATVEAADMAAEILDPAPEAADENPETTEAYDEALLDMVALEMGAPDPDEFDDAPVAAADEIDAMELPEPMPAEPVTFARETVPWAAPQPAQASLQPSLEPSPKPDVEPSLGSTFLAGGFLQKPKPSASDPLAPIRRMSQAEKIAFFS